MKRKAEKGRVARQAKRNIDTTIDRNLGILSEYLDPERADTVGLDCIRDPCTVEIACRTLLEETVRILEDTKGSFRSRKLMDLRGKILAFLADEEEHAAPRG